MSTRQTLKDYLNRVVGVPVGQISYVDDPRGGDTSALDPGDDLGIDPNTGKELVGFGSPGGLVPGYTAYITQESRNEYSIDASGPTSEASSSRRGQNLTRAEDQGARKVFVKSNEYPPTTQYFESSGTDVNSVVDKVGRNPTTSGDKIIKDVKAAQENTDTILGQSPAVTGAFKMLKKYNRYADTNGSIDGTFIDSNLADTPTISSNVDERIRLSFQVEKGAYTPGSSNTARHVKSDNLHEIAHSMLLKAAGWDPTTSATDSPDPATFMRRMSPTDFQKYPTIINSLFPDQVRPAESYGAPVEGGNSLLGGRGEAVTRDGSDAKYSVSNTTAYTPDVTFTHTTLGTGALRKFSAYQAAIAITSLSRLIKGTLQSHTISSEEADAGLGPFYMGKSPQRNVESSFKAISKIILVNTGRFDFDQCVRAGVLLYFGIDVDNISASSIEETAKMPLVLESHGFWNAIARSVIRSMSMFENSMTSQDFDDAADSIVNLMGNKALRVANVFAEIGYTYLAAHLEEPDAGIDNTNVDGKLSTAFDIDSFASLPGNRVMKSREQTIRSELSLAWRHSAVPSAFLLPPTLIRATLDMDYIFDGPNPVKHMVGGSMRDKTYVSTRVNGRIPIEVVNNLENRLDAEYVPFYFHDLRTNEVVGLHAFLDTLTDSYAASYGGMATHGRADTVKTYGGTKRSIGFSFWVVSTSPEDFDEMWAKINKIVTLVYPQYTSGNLVQDKKARFNQILGTSKNFTFEQPFSQVMGGTPVIRLRIGDVIKSNYSRFNIARLFGVGNPEAGAITENTDLTKIWGGENSLWSWSMLPIFALIASPAELLTISSLQTGWPGLAKVGIADLLDSTLVNGFVNPLLNVITPQSWSDKAEWTQRWSSFNGQIFLKPRFEPYTFVDAADSSKKKSVRILRPTMVNVTTKSSSVSNNQVNVNVEIKDSFFNLAKSSFVVAGGDENLENYKCEVGLDQCLIDPDTYFGAVLQGAMVSAQLLSSPTPANAANRFIVESAGLGITTANNALASAGVSINFLDTLQDLAGTYARQFTSPLNNPVTHAIEGSMGRGLAGVVTSLQFSWLDQQSTWNIDWNGRAPMACKITMNFEPIHDISPGLDAYGANRAPVYNVGSMIKIAGDPHQDHGRKSRVAYGNNGDELALKIYQNEEVKKIRLKN